MDCITSIYKSFVWQKYWNRRF